MDYQIKMMIVDAITNVVKNAPTKQNMYYNTITKEIFEAWMKYVNSILEIISRYININIMLSLKVEIENILLKHDDYRSMINNICDVLLNFAKYILYL